jgi:hypothetical protein
MARQRNNIYAITADAVDLALDTAGAIGSMVGGLANAIIGIGGGDREKLEIEDAARRVTASVRQEAEAAKPHTSRTHSISSAKKVGKTSGRSKRRTTTKRAAAAGSHSRRHRPAA